VREKGVHIGVVVCERERTGWKFGPPAEEHVRLERVVRRVKYVTGEFLVVVAEVRGEFDGDSVLLVVAVVPAVLLVDVAHSN
jgi:hypothetical protein